ncbi:unnamed protein product [Cuscuta epithymum]|uniref:Uncharacterized protein n=1 Tax=Cuscuta epithymum TaxID=186058 RepID=A0AAV0G1U2_9ASTE|nr:unnamed protein product [Cuscuta epithymum]
MSGPTFQLSSIALIFLLIKKKLSTREGKESGTKKTHLGITEAAHTSNDNGGAGGVGVEDGSCGLRRASMGLRWPRKQAPETTCGRRLCSWTAGHGAAADGGRWRAMGRRWQGRAAAGGWMYVGVRMEARVRRKELKLRVL